MAQEYLVKDTSLTAIADEIRVLSGKTGAMGLDAMASTINTENTNFESNLSAQDSLISQIQTALQNKAGGSAEPVLQEKTVSPTTSSQSVIPDSGYDGLSKVTVNAMPTATQATPSISVDSAGKITASATQTAGYVSAGTKSATKQLTTQAAKTITPSTSSQTAVAKNVYTTGAVTVNPIPSNYIVPSGTKTITTNGTHDVKSYASATVNVAGEDVSSETNAYTTKLATLETAITALETELQGKASGGGGSGGGTISVTVYNNSVNPVYYWDANGVLNNVSANSTATVDALNGVLYYIQENQTICNGAPNTYLSHIVRGLYVTMFLANGGNMTCYPTDGGI